MSRGTSREGTSTVSDPEVIELMSKAVCPPKPSKGDVK